MRCSSRRSYCQSRDSFQVYLYRRRQVIKMVGAKWFRKGRTEGENGRGCLDVALGRGGGDKAISEL